MLKELLKNTKLLSKVKRFYKKNEKEIIDILLFGSSVRGKTKPSDVDLLIIFKEKEDFDIVYELKKMLKDLEINFQITSKKYSELFKPTFQARECILSESHSLINDVGFSQGLGYSNMKIFRYKLNKLNKSKRMRFYYALYGRNGSKGILKELNAKKFAETILICPIERSEDMKEFLKQWDLDYLEVPILISSRILPILKS